MSELDRVLERVRQNRAAGVQQGRTPAAPVSPQPTRVSGMLTAGDRVFDTVSGQEAIVLARTTENVVVHAAQR